jgi:23S rRNA pseudouridine955/2504/2580 synthase
MGILPTKKLMNEHIVNTVLPVRLDRYLKRVIPALSQGVIEQHLRTKKIKVNGEKAVNSLRVSEGDKITIPQSLLINEATEFGDQIKLEFSPGAIKLAGKLKGEYLLFENEYFMVITKPAKLATQGGSKINLSVNDALEYLNYENKTELKLVHRLDKETSGILIIAKDYYAAARLAQGFQDKLVEKNYFAVVIGKMPKSSGEIACMLGKNREGTYDKVQVDPENGKLAVTKYKVIKKLRDVSLVEFTPVTGRTHQLRVHAQMLGCPIVGDNKYGNHANTDFSGNMLLHAERLMLRAEIFGKEFSFHAQIPEYFNKFIAIKA